MEGTLRTSSNPNYLPPQIQSRGGAAWIGEVAGLRPVCSRAQTCTRHTCQDSKDHLRVSNPPSRLKPILQKVLLMFRPMSLFPGRRQLDRGQPLSSSVSAGPVHRPQFKDLISRCRPNLMYMHFTEEKWAQVGGVMNCPCIFLSIHCSFLCERKIFSSYCCGNRVSQTGPWETEDKDASVGTIGPPRPSTTAPKTG